MAESPTPFAEIDLGPSKLDQFLDAHQKKLIIGAILIAIAVVVYVVYSGIAKGQAEDAGAALLNAKKVEDYQAVIKDWPNSAASSTALLLMADAQAQKSPDEAIETLKKFIDANPKHPVLATAKVSLALLLIEQKQESEATTLLTEVVDSETGSYLAPLACISLGDIAKAAGKTDEAKTWYEKAKGDDPDSANSFADIAEVRLALVNALPPKKIKPAPPTPPAPEAAKTPPTAKTPLPPKTSPAPAVKTPQAAPTAPIPASKPAKTAKPAAPTPPATPEKAADTSKETP